MKQATIWVFLLILASGYADGQPCPNTDTLVFNSSTLPGGVLPGGNDSAHVILIGSGTSGYITTSPGTTTHLVVAAPEDFVTTAQIIFSQNFETNIGSGGVFTASFTECGKIEVSTPTASSDALPSKPASVLIYPTVSTGVVTVTGSSVSLGNADMLVADESGRTVYHLHNGKNTTVSLYLGHLANGLYFLRINNGTGLIMVQKIVISK